MIQNLLIIFLKQSWMAKTMLRLNEKLIIKLKMERHYRMVIDLYKEAIQHQVNSDRILEARKQIASAITTARINNKDTQSLLEIENDIKTLEDISR